MPQYSKTSREPDRRGRRARTRRFWDANFQPGGADPNTIRYELTNPDWKKSPVIRIIAASGTTTLNTNDFGKVILSTTNDKYLTFPNPVGNSSETFSVIQGITRNTVFQCVNATAGKFGTTGDSAVNSLRINTFADWVQMISTGIDWIVTPLGNTINTLTKNVATSF